MAGILAKDSIVQDREINLALKSIADAAQPIIKAFDDIAIKGNAIANSVGGLQNLTSIINLSQQAANNTNGLSVAQKELLKIQNQIATLQSRQTQAYRDLNRQRQEALYYQQQENKQIREQLNNLNGQRSSFQRLTSAIRNYVAAYISVQAVMGLSKSIYNQTKELDQLSFSMKTVIKDTNELASSQKFLSETAMNYGGDLLSISERYIKFRAAAMQSNMTMAETQKIFDSVSKASGVLGLKTDETAGVYLALEQMISKGKVTTEELRRQLGERLPGAFGIMANALGVTIAELDKMLKKGQIMSSEALPKFADALQKAYGIESLKTVDTLSAAQGRLTTNWTNFIKELEASDTFKGIINLLSSMLRFMSENANAIKFLSKSALLAVEAWVLYRTSVALTNWVQKQAITIQETRTLSTGRQIIVTRAATMAETLSATATKSLTGAWIGLNLAMKANPIWMILSLVTTLATAILLFKDNTDKAASTTKTFEDAANEARTELELLFDTLKRAKTGSELYKEALSQINNIYGKYLDNLITEKDSLDQINLARAKAISGLQDEMYLKERNKRLDSLNETLVKTQGEQRDIIMGIDAGTPMEKGLFFKSLIDAAQNAKDTTELSLEQVTARKKAEDRLIGNNQGEKNLIQERLGKNLAPFAYDTQDESQLERIIKSLFLNEKEKLRNKIDKNPTEIHKRRMDAYGIYLGDGQLNNTFLISKFNPSESKDKNNPYYAINNDDLKNYLLQMAQFPQNGKLRNDNINSGIMGNYSIGRGEDKNGKYISYYDKWDIAPIDFGKPFEIYDRIYYELDANGKAVEKKITKSVSQTEALNLEMQKMFDLIDAQTDKRVKEAKGTPLLITKEQQQEAIRLNAEKEKQKILDAYNTLVKTSTDYNNKFNEIVSSFPITPKKEDANKLNPDVLKNAKDEFEAYSKLTTDLTKKEFLTKKVFMEDDTDTYKKYLERQWELFKNDYDSRVLIENELSELYKKDKKGSSGGVDKAAKTKLDIAREQAEQELFIFKQSKQKELNEQEKHLDKLFENRDANDQDMATYESALDETHYNNKVEEINKEIELNEGLLKYTKENSLEREKIETDLTKLKMDLDQETTNFEIANDKNQVKIRKAILAQEKKDAVAASNKELSDAESDIHNNSLDIIDKAGQEIDAAKGKAFKIKAIEDQLTLDLIKNEKERLQAALDSGKVIGADREQLVKRINELEERYNIKSNETRRENDKVKLEGQREVVNESANLLNAGFEFAKQVYDNQLQIAKQSFDDETAYAGDNLEAQLIAKRKYEAEVKKIRRRQAAADKAQAAFNIVLSTTLGIMKVWEQFGGFPPVAIALSAIVGAIGAVNLGAVLSKPIPEYFMGTDELKDETFSAGERGREAIIKPDGEVIVTPNKKTIFSDPSFIGSQILPHDKTEQFLANYAVSQGAQVFVDMSDTNRHLASMDSQMKKKEPTSYIDAKGRLTVKNRNVITHY